MAHCYYHALSSVRKWGGNVEDYLPLHQWFDQSKAILADPRHRALRHHAEGIFMLETLFGATIVNADGRSVPVRLVGEQHVREDLGRSPRSRTGRASSLPRPGCFAGIVSTSRSSCQAIVRLAVTSSHPAALLPWAAGLASRFEAAPRRLQIWANGCRPVETERAWRSCRRHP